LTKAVTSQTIDVLLTIIKPPNIAPTFKSDIPKKVEVNIRAQSETTISLPEFEDANGDSV
jgi:flagellar assembly factor FliW